MIHFHPDDNILAEYSAGSLSTALAISVKSHLYMCSKCRERVSQLNLVGSALVMNANIEDEDKNYHKQTFSALMERIRSTPNDTFPHERDQANSDPSLPPIIQSLIPERNQIKWHRVSPSLKQANLNTGQSKYEVCLHKISKGGKVAHHDHRGMEATLVLKGAFSDENGTYKAGDFILRYPGEKHRPCATQNQDCLCLSVTEAPVKLTGFLGTVLNPFLSFNPA